MKIYFKLEIKEPDLFWEISEKVRAQMHYAIMQQLESYLKIK